MNLMMNIGKSGVKSFQNQVNVGGHNIANSNTTAFKKTYDNLKDLQYYETNGVLMDNGMYNQGVGVQSDDSYEDFKQGSLVQSGTHTHYAVKGEGYFGVYDRTTNQTLLTRDGSFVKNSLGELVDINGNQVMMKIMRDEAGNEYQIPALYKPREMLHLNKVNESYYEIDANNMISNINGSQGFGEVENGYLESSNVDLGEEMTNLMIAQRAYSMNMKVVQTADETSQLINNLR